VSLFGGLTFFSGITAAPPPSGLALPFCLLASPELFHILMERPGSRIPAGPGGSRIAGWHFLTVFYLAFPPLLSRLSPLPLTRHFHVFKGRFYPIFFSSPRTFPRAKDIPLPGAPIIFPSSCFCLFLSSPLHVVRLCAGHFSTSGSASDDFFDSF